MLLRKRRSGQAHELEVARVGVSVPALGGVSPAISGSTVAAETTIGWTDRKTEFPKLDLGDVASLFFGVSRKNGQCCHGDQAEPSVDQLSSSALARCNGISHVDSAVLSPYSIRFRKKRRTCCGNRW